MTEVLGLLCKIHGFSYAVRWKFDVRNPRLLVMYDSYFEEHTRIAFGKTIPQVHLVGEGTTGVVAINGKHQWIYFDTFFEGNSEWQHQFLAGIKSIVIIYLPCFGVVQFGSIEKVPESAEFVNQVQDTLSQREDIMPDSLPVNDCRVLCQNYASSLSINGISNVESTNSIPSLDHFPWDNQSVSTSIDNQFTKNLPANSFSSLQTFPNPFIQSYPSNTFATNLSSNSCTKDLSNNHIPYYIGNSISSSSSIASEARDSFLSFAQGPATENSMLIQFNNSFKADQSFHYVQPSEIGREPGSYSTLVKIPTEPSENYASTSTNVLNKLHDTNQTILENDLFEGMNFDLSPRVLNDNSWDDILLPLCSNNSSNVSTSVSSFEQLFQSVIDDNANLLPVRNSTPISSDSFNFENQASTTSTNRKTTPSPEFSLEKIIRQSSMHNESAITTNTRKPEGNTKVVKKRARPGESTRPRPKDRQQIQDRVKELREIVPNTAKCSIDSLLDRTIKHMLFLQSVTKYADKLKLTDEPKMIGNESGVILKDNISSNGGSTWAYEVAGQTMVCPILVEDVNPPGQMLVEMLCEERGFFLEIADIIRGFGLTILKGVMEIRDGKIWARFMVEANRDVTRMDIFLSLVQLLQQTSTIQISEPGDKALGTSNNYQQPQMQTPIRLQ